MKRFNEKELAERWGLKTRTIQNWRREKVGPPYSVLGRHTVVYLEEEVIQYEQSRRVKTKESV